MKRSEAPNTRNIIKSLITVYKRKEPDSTFRQAPYFFLKIYNYYPK